MAFTDELADLKKELGAAKISISSLLAAAGVDRSTWTRWANGTCMPRMEKWSAVRAAADRLLGKGAKSGRRAAA